ncbi:unnamed protein product [Closterium sp. NIES-53]
MGTRANDIWAGLTTITRPTLNQPLTELLGRLSLTLTLLLLAPTTTRASTLRSRPTTTGPTASAAATPSAASTSATRASTSATSPTAATTSTASASSTAAPTTTPTATSTTTAASSTTPATLALAVAALPNRDLTGGFRGNRAFASAADEADQDEKNVDNASEEAGPLPYCSVPIPMDVENPREIVNAETYFDFADTGYVTPQPVATNISERVGPNFIPDLEAGDEATYPEDTNLPRYTQSGLQILGLVTSVHGAEPHKEPATIQQALGGEHREKWCEAMDKELKALQERNTWKVVPIEVARNKTIIMGKWIFRVKTKADGTIDKFKARWVVLLETKDGVYED